MLARNSLSSAGRTFLGAYSRCTWGDPLVLPVPPAHAPRGDRQGLQACAGPCPCLGVRLRGRFVGAVTFLSAPTFSKSGALRGGCCHHGLLCRAGYALGVRNASAEMGLPARYNRAFQAELHCWGGAKK